MTAPWPAPPARITTPRVVVRRYAREDAEGKGLMPEVVAGLTTTVLNLGIATRVEIHCEPANVRSRHVRERLGFTLEDTRMGPCGWYPEERLIEIWAVDADTFSSTVMAHMARPNLAGADGTEVQWPA